MRTETANCWKRGWAVGRDVFSVGAALTLLAACGGASVSLPTGATNGVRWATGTARSGDPASGGAAPAPMPQGWGGAAPAPMPQGSAPSSIDVESLWPIAEANPSLQAVFREVTSRTLAQLGTSRDREVLCSSGTTVNAARARARAAQSLLLPLHPLLTRRAGEMTASEPTIRALFDASEALLAPANPSVPRVEDGLMWALAEAYAQKVCVTDADVPALVTAAITMVNEDPFLRSQFTTLFTAPIVPADVPGRYWTKRNDLVGAARGALTSRAARAPALRPGAPVFGQASSSGAPFSCESNLLRTYDRSGPGADNGIHEAGEVFGLTLRCRNTSGQRLLSQSIVLADTTAPNIVFGREEVVVPEAAAGETFEVPLGPLYVASSAGPRPEPLALRVLSSRGRSEGTMELRFQPLAVGIVEVGFTAPDEDVAGASERDDSPALGPDDRFEMQVRIRVPVEYTPAITGVALAYAPDATIFDLGSLASPDVATDPGSESGGLVTTASTGAPSGNPYTVPGSVSSVFVTIDDLDGRVGSREVCASLDTRSPLAIVRVPGRRFAKIDVGLSVSSPITLAQIASRIAPVSFFAAATALGQRQGMPTRAAWNAIRDAASALQPATALLARWEEERKLARSAWPPSPDPAAVVARVTEAVRVLEQSRVIDPATRRALLAQFPAPCPGSDDAPACGAPRTNVRVDPGTLSRFMLLCHALGERDANSECESLLRTMAMPTPEASVEQIETRVPLARRLLQWSMLASAFGDNAWKILAGIDVRTSDPEAFLENDTAVRNALAASLDAPLSDDAPTSAAPARSDADEGSSSRRRRRDERAAEAAPAATPPASPAILRAVALAATTTIPELPSWSLSRFVSLPLE